ncbi:MAG: aminotransferase class V-fold PLP-dependent enzyme [Sulfobacillus thermosulfidooxidans]|uniref:Aminotransferase n=1 Tax=Sulfobacillus thermotolerans TaxID=338644 RepID=A0ABM6RR92_9FIRM|nr:aminotransferase class I/II-fold pyridoxal phosphate-dependent enzyme [Sulfobacillus sp. hq2]AUW93814.1 aromatic amino acid aminotransferase [Sulfobacillus thermotolerans]POB11373.1 aromatic amino acid aminotransferase [Sulfobacillus sp. hq2]PSR35856.1 MAG: aminotransferase class V-fold PLP-dependent enzyme [Sulfobacillus thermosulfidooxidans]
MTTLKDRLAPLAASLPPSGIRRFFDLASTMKDVISLGVGEPDFVTPWHIRESGLHALERGMTAYTANAGLFELRSAISRYLESFGTIYQPENEILVTVGGSEAIDLAIRVLAGPGDEVLIAEPAYVSYRPLVHLTGATPVTVPLRPENGFQLDANDIRARLNSRTKAIILCNPNNPTGAVLTRAQLEPIAQVLKEADLFAIVDEIYAELTYDHPHTSFPSLPGMQERTVLIGGMSKAYAMTGWRLGYAAAPEYILHAMLTIHQYTILCAPVAAQVAGIEALNRGRGDVTTMVAEYDARRRLITKGLNELGLLCPLPQGAFYVFPDIRGTGLTSEQFAESLLIHGQVAVVPGNVFGDQGEGFVRCSYATSVGHIEKALERMRKFLTAGRD